MHEPDVHFDADDQPPASVREICEALWKIEAQEDLYNWNVLGIRLWPLIRFRVFYNLTKSSGIYTWKVAPDIKFPAGWPAYKGTKGYLAFFKGMTSWRWHLRGLIPKSMQDPRLQAWREATDMVAPFSNRDAKGFEKYSAPVLEILGDKALRWGVGTWDHDREWPHLDRMQDLFRAKWGRFYALFIRLALRKADYEKYARVIKFLEAETRSSVGPYKNFPRWTLRHHMAERHGYRLLFKRMNIKRLFMVNASRMNLIAAAQSCGIKVIELQCGVFSPYNVQFSWPGRPNIPYLPNEIWTWGDYWTSGIDNSGLQNIVVSGATEEFEAVRERGTNQKPKTIVVMSQPLIGAALYADSLKLARLNPDYKIVFKMHPKDVLDEFVGEQPANFTIAPESSRSLDLLAESEICVGVFSTTLIEAAGLGNKVAMLKLSGWEHLLPLVNSGHAAAFGTIEELSAGLSKLPPPGDPYFFYGKRIDYRELIAKA